MQIGKYLVLQELGVDLSLDNYQEICDVLYLAGKRGVNFADRIYFDEKSGHAYSVKSHEDGGHPSWGLEDDIFEMSREVEDVEGWVLDDLSLERLRRLKKDIDEKGVRVC